MHKLSLKGLTKRYGKLTAVDKVDLTMRQGEFVSLLGPSGCGKTTTLRMIAGFIAPDEGTIEVGGQILSSTGKQTPPERRGMSMIFQSYAIWPNMTVFENVAFGLSVRHLPREEIKRRVEEILSIVRLSQLAGRYPNELSGGQQQRVALARAIVVKPEVLLLDEPLSNLDANLREEMRAEIRRLHDEFKITTVYVTHDQAEAMATSDRIAVMDRGRIEQIDDPYTVYTRPMTRFVAGFIGRTNFIEARRDGSLAQFDGFAIPLQAMAVAPPEGNSFSVSVRPQSIALHRTSAIDADRIGSPASLVQRSFLGDQWDYVVAVQDSALRLHVSAPANHVFEVGQPLWLSIDPSTAVPIAQS